MQLGATGLTTQITKTNQLAGEGLTLGANNQWTQNYTITPVTDPDQLRRLRILFQYATRSLPEVNYAKPGAQTEADKVFEASYPIIEASPSSAGSEPNLTVTIDGKSVAVKQASGGTAPQKKRYVRRQFALDEQGKIVGYKWSIVSPDRTFITQPGCIMCDYGNKVPENSLKYTTDPDILQHYDSFIVLEKNYDLRDNWLYPPQQMPPAGAIALPSAGVSHLYANDPTELKFFYEFALFCVEASSQGTGSPSSGGQSEGRKTTSPQTIFSIPVSGGILP